MAQVVLGIGTPHLPSLNQREGSVIERWTRAAKREESPDLRGGGMLMNLDIPKLKKEREGWIGKELAPEVWQRRADACQAALNQLTGILDEVDPDVAVIIGDDSYEVFPHGHMPMVDLFMGDEIPWQPRDWSRQDSPSTRGLTTCLAGAPELAKHVAGGLKDQGFDVSVTTEIQEGYSIGHAFDFIYGRIMNQTLPEDLKGSSIYPVLDVPNQIPIWLNTYYFPNVMTLPRCYTMGKALRRAIESWDNDARVVVIGTGGLSHMIIDEKLDHEVLDTLQEKDEDHLKEIPEEPFVFGTSETRCWLMAAGAMHESDMDMNLITYEPGYRSAAGLGCACGFAYWK